MGDGLLGRLRNSVGAGLEARRRGRGGRAAKPDVHGDAAPGPPGPSGPDDRTAAVDHSRTGGISVTYAPEHDGDADPGEVVWAWVPYEDDPTQGKDRPVLIVGYDGALLAGVQLSSRDHSNRSDGHEWVPVGTGAWDSQRRPSYADASRLLRFQPGEVRREGAALHRDRFDEVLARVSQIHDWSDRR